MKDEVWMRCGRDVEEMKLRDEAGGCSKILEGDAGVEQRYVERTPRLGGADGCVTRV